MERTLKPFWMVAAVVTVIVAVTSVETARTEHSDNVDYLSDLENEVLREHNLARTNPGKYATYVAEWLQYYHGKKRTIPGRLPIQTTEGKRGVIAAVRFLEAQDPLPPLRASQGLARAAHDHVEDTGKKGWLGHLGSDDSEPADRVNRYGTWYGRVGENITYGGWDARELVVRLIIDDGIPNRGHRKNVFNPDFTLAGIAFGHHETYGSMCVITYAAEFEER
jgi:uncharacterized protein YkwD